MRRSILTFAATCAVAVGATLFLSASPADAQGCGAGACLAGGQQVTSSVIVQHYDTSGESDIPVEPDTGETIEVTAYWDAASGAAPACSCKRTATASVTVDVDWNETTDSWDVTCTGCNVAGPIYGVSVCHSDGCGSHTTIDNAWEYELLVDLQPINQWCAANPGTISGVLYETTSVDDGDTIRTSNCTEWNAVSPTSQTFSVSDLGPYECDATCATASGPTLLLEYQ